jgi:methionyl-tRNA formyltransferase
MSNFIFFGTGGLLSSICLNHLAAKNINPLMVFIQKSNSTVYPNLTELVCKKENIDYVLVESVNNPETIHQIHSLEPEFAIIASFGEIFKKPLIGSFPIYNVHMGVLPDYRGAYTNFWKIIEGHDSYGVTIHQIDEKIDSGHSLLIKEKDFSTVSFADQFFRLNYQMAAEALEEVMNQIKSNSIVKRPISTESGKYYRKHTIEDMNLDPLENVEQLHKKINRLQFYGNPTLFGKSLTECSLLFSGNLSVDSYIATEISGHSFLLKNKSGIIRIKHL